MVGKWGRAWHGGSRRGVKNSIRWWWKVDGLLCVWIGLGLDFVACGKVKVWSVKRKKDGECFLQPLVQKVAHSWDMRRTHFSKKMQVEIAHCSLRFCTWWSSWVDWVDWLLCVVVTRILFSGSQLGTYPRRYVLLFSPPEGWKWGSIFDCACFTLQAWVEGLFVCCVRQGAASGVGGEIRQQQVKMKWQHFSLHAIAQIEEQRLNLSRS